MAKVRLLIDNVSNSQTACSEGPSTQEIHLDHGRVVTTEATIKVKHFRGGEELIRMENTHISEQR